jgi:hypothetical protein
MEAGLSHAIAIIDKDNNNDNKSSKEKVTQVYSYSLKEKTH